MPYRCRWRRWRPPPGSSAFLPTDYKGISELGKIAGAGMLVAFLTSITTCRRCSTCSIRPEKANRSVMPSWRRSITFSKSIASSIIVGTLLVAVAGLPLLYFMKFDFNPINLRNKKAESIATFLDLRKDPNTGANAVNVMTKSEADAKKIEAKRLRKCRKWLA